MTEPRVARTGEGAGGVRRLRAGWWAAPLLGGALLAGCTTEGAGPPDSGIAQAQFAAEACCSDDTRCQDGLYCNGRETCNCWGECEPGPPINCDDGDPCTNDWCDEEAPGDDLGRCRHTPLATPECGGCDSADDCDDRNACTDDVCNPATGECSNPGISCDDGNVCTSDSCDSGTGCENEPIPGCCRNDADCRETPDDLCTTDRCEPATATCTRTPVTCNDSNICTDDSCVPASGCVYTNNAAPCSDGNTCTVGDVCSGGACTPGAPRVCPDDGNVCTTEACDSVVGCTRTNNTLPCSDGNACTNPDACSGGSCGAGPAVVCNDSNICTDDSCVPATGCRYVNNTAPCSDGNACTNPDACSGGSCRAGPGLVCNDGNICTDDTCNAGIGCVFTNNTAPCSDGSACTNPDACSGGSCRAGPAVVCNDGNVCTDDSCVPATGCRYVNNTAVCNDGSACTNPDRCSGGVCSGTAIVCSDTNQCTIDGCNPATGCTFTPNTGAPCTYTVDPCLNPGICTSGAVCGPGPLNAPPNDRCPGMITITLDAGGDGSASGTTQCALPDYGGTCGGGGAGSGGKDVTYTFSYTVSTTEAQLYGRNVLLNGPFDTVLYARDVCLTSGTETNCNNNCTSWALLNCGAYGLDGNDSAFSITPPPIWTTDRVDLIVDGYTASAWGNYTVRVDRINWANNPCWDADDNQRRVDATAGGTWRGNISGYRNDIYCSDGSGYVGTPCDNQGSWGCGRSGFYGDYWHPARAWFLLAPGAAQRYCIWTNETAVSDWFDTVIEVWDNTVPGYPGGCDGWVSHVTCNAVPGRQGAPRTGATRVDLTVPAGERYMVGVSRRVWDATSTQYEIHFDLGGC